MLLLLLLLLLELLLLLLLSVFVPGGGRGGGRRTGGVSGGAIGQAATDGAGRGLVPHPAVVAAVFNATRAAPDVLLVCQPSAQAQSDLTGSRELSISIRHHSSPRIRLGPISSFGRSIHLLFDCCDQRKRK